VQQKQQRVNLVERGISYCLCCRNLIGQSFPS